jgi:hypothetical protein
MASLLMRRQIRKHGERAGRIVPEISDEHESEWTAIDRHSAAPRRVKCTPPERVTYVVSESIISAMLGA